jgi:hypothetical protein
MRKPIFNGLLILAIQMLFLTTLQSQTSIRGLAQDNKSQALASATALLRQATDSTLVKGVICNDLGIFQFENLSAGNYFVEVDMLGYAPVFSKPISVNNDPGNIDLGNLQLSEDHTMLNEVSVVAKRPFLEQKIDRTIVNVANSITNAGGNALQVLQRSPGVQVNQLTNSISMAGKEGVVIMINGKISRLPADAIVQMLAGMTAENIDRIELIHTPPSNFDAEGSAGIINIVLKNTGDAGFNGGYSAKAGYGRGEKYGAGAYFNYRKKKANWYGGYDYYLNNNPQVFTNYRGVQQGNDFLETETFSDRYSTPYPTHNVRLGADFQLSPKTVFGALGTFFDGNWDMDATNDVTYSTNGNVDSLLRMPNTEINHTRSVAGNLNLAHQINKNQSLNLDADYIEYDINNPSYYNLQNPDANGNFNTSSELRIGKKTPIQVAVGKADYTVNFGSKSKLETGGKFTSMRFENDVSVESRVPQQDWMLIPELTSKAKLNESLAAAYATFSTKFDAKTDIKAGLRYEYTNTHLGTETEPDLVDRQYGSWFPSLFITRKFSETKELNLTYSRRITRPQIRQLAPWLIFIDPTTLQGGNAAIQPSFTDALNLNYSFKAYRLSLSYSLEDAPMRYVPLVDAQTNRQIIRPDNLDREQVASLNLFVPLNPTKWWGLTSNFFLNTTSIDFTLEGQKFLVQNVNYGFNATNTFSLPKQFTLEVSGSYSSPGYWGIAYWDATGRLDIGLEKNFGDKWGKLRFSASNLFESDNWFGTTRQPDINLYTKASFEFAERSFILSWTNTFGNKKLKSSRQRQTGASEEMQRISG